MNVYSVQQQEIHTMTVLIEAENEDDARRKFMNGEYSNDDIHLELDGILSLPTYELVDESNES